MLFSFALSLALVAQERSWQTAIVNGEPVKVWGWREGDSVRWIKAEQPPSPPPAPPEVQGLGTPGRPQGESSGEADLPAYALNGVIANEIPPERVIFTNVPELAPKLARKYGVRVETDGEPPAAYPGEANAIDPVIAPIAACAVALLLLGIKLRQP